MANGTVLRRIALSAAAVAATSAAVVLVPRTVGATWAGVHATLGALTARDVGTFFQVPAARITAVANGLDHTRFQPGPQSAAGCCAN